MKTEIGILFAGGFTLVYYTPKGTPEFCGRDGYWVRHPKHVAPFPTRKEAQIAANKDNERQE